MYSQIYLDYNATTYCDPEVLEAMLPHFGEHFGNASSSHHPYGWMAKDALDEATGQIASTLGIRSDEIVYTSGSTEGINMVLKGIIEGKEPADTHIITTQTEHKAVLDVCRHLESSGVRVTYLGVNRDGLIDVDQLDGAITSATALAAILYANNETGVIQPLETISAICRAKGVPLFMDATQALGKLSLDSLFEQVDFACFSGHKVYGPKGIGFNFIRKAAAEKLTPFIHGGGQQHGLRGGTYNVPLIVGLARAIRLAEQHRAVESKRMERLRRHFEAGMKAIPEVRINGQKAARLPNTSNVSFAYVDGQYLLRALSRSMAVSNGSACNSAAEFPSHVLTAMGLDEPLAFASLRISLGRKTTEEEVDRAVQYIREAVAQLRSENILWERRG